ncbi:3'(2'),5'-bisphosphate nucleotidase CysQ [uncultured Sphingomonas sp.]|uniref:3'(2'),5'-bisphosphate nucleotidase CysQ n=1 Tax=uncultured Sphingomonas sp. TaxID=158754 RepID=UPI0035CB74F3
MAKRADELLPAVAAIVADAGRMAMARWRTDFDRWEKAPGDPVSEVDLAVDAQLREALAGLMPDAGWLSEETVDDADRLRREHVWIVDPIDGTRDYIRGRAGWAVSVALVERGRVVLGVLDAPARGEAWTAVLGRGARRNGEALHASDRAALLGARVPADTLPKADRDLVAAPKPNSIALRVATVASGEADFVATQRWGHEWDIAAAALIASEAGAIVTNALGEPLGFNKRDPRAFGLMIGAPGLHAAALERFGPRARAILAAA